MGISMGMCKSMGSTTGKESSTHLPNSLASKVITPHPQGSCQRGKYMANAHGLDHGRQCIWTPGTSYTDLWGAGGDMAELRPMVHSD